MARPPSCSPSAGSSPTSRSRSRLTAEPTPRTVERDGLRIAALDWGGDGEPLLLLHPNGFGAGLFDPLARRLTDRFHPIGVDLRGHGGTDVPPDTGDGYAFWRLAGDVAAVLDHLGVDRWVALGESLGGGVCSALDELRPGATRRLMLCEAIAFDLAAAGRDRAPGTGPGEPNSMAAIARRRRAVWPDRATVLASYGARPPLDALAPEALEAYVRWGFVDRPDGRVELACPPEAEATLFEVTAIDDGAPAAWRHLDALTAPATVLAGTRSDLPVDWFRAQADRAHAPFVLVDGGHFFLQEDTDRAERLVREHLG
ncbi:MAG TPA: alpha/beta hydrolase [Acidimicrobiia bacterium]|nr:alpha/beta hydrolase [Acidimicrobiia bacterium]